MTTTSTTWEPSAPQQVLCPRCGKPTANLVGVHALIRTKAGVLIDCTLKPYQPEEGR